MRVIKKMHIHFIEKKIDYDGTQIESLWGLRNFNIQGDSIIAFTGGCNISFENMVDIIDLTQKTKIYSELKDNGKFILSSWPLDNTIAINKSEKKGSATYYLYTKKATENDVSVAQ